MYKWSSVEKCQLLKWIFVLINVCSYAKKERNVITLLQRIIIKVEESYILILLSKILNLFFFGGFRPKFSSWNSVRGGGEPNYLLSSLAQVSLSKKGPSESWSQRKGTPSIEQSNVFSFFTQKKSFTLKFRQENKCTIGLPHV